MIYYLVSDFARESEKRTKLSGERNVLQEYLLYVGSSVAKTFVMPFLLALSRLLLVLMAAEQRLRAQCTALSAEFAVIDYATINTSKESAVHP